MNEQAELQPDAGQPHADLPTPRSNPLKWILLSFAGTISCCCGGFLYLFMFYCPDPVKLPEIRKELIVGMPATEASKYFAIENRRWGSPEDVLKGVEPKPVPEGMEDFTGYMWDSEMCSDQCDAKLYVYCQNGVVTRISFYVYNDRDHTVRRLK